MNQQWFNIPCAAQIGIQVLNALEHIHNLGYVHGDVQLENFVVKGLIDADINSFGFHKTFDLANDPGAGTIVLVDFG